MSEKITSDTAHDTASAIVLDIIEKKVLLVWHNATGKWVFPGGHVDKGEDAREAAAKEVLEETGVVVHVAPTLFHSERFRAPAKPDRPGKPAEVEHWHDDMLFIGFADSRAPIKVKEDEVKQAAWVPIDKAHMLDVREEVPARLAAAWALVKGE